MPGHRLADGTDVAPDDVVAVARPVLGHRLAGGTDVVSAGLDATPIPVA